VIALGYKGEVIKDYFLNYQFHSRSLSVDLGTGKTTLHNRENEEDWTVHLLDTGINTQTGGRIKQVSQFIDSEPFLLTYGDGVSNININKLIEFHNTHGRLATITAVRPPARFGQMNIEGDRVIKFEEKPQIGEGWINGGFYVLQPEISRYIKNDQTFWEHEPLEQLATEGQLAAYHHEDFWYCMDTIRDVNILDKFWKDGNAPWKIWA
jgi:glucose-1-phosphate cytidylyltransferase